MISEKNIASEFKGFWSESLPLLTPSFVRVFNEVSLIDLTEYHQTKIRRVPIGPQVEKHDLVAEFAFQLAMRAHEKSLWIDELKLDKSNVEAAYIGATSFLKKYEAGNGVIVLNENEVEESFTLAEQYDYFIETRKADDIEFSPQVAGAGFLGLCKADLSIDETLYEVKTVSRNIAGKDIKQLLIYLALQHSTGRQRWKYAGFYNPRKAQCYRFSIDHLIYRTSGGKSTSELFSDVIDFLGSRGVELDTAF
ncbi:hypothetical protein [Halomonas sp. BC04]|uniref:hypothetical protein n=1 Tax=Halomonas sp. BC04 TaxID=1403540 RepID=UPI0012DDC7B1|nr:hypothetical protein [Halomonas sp. BC04]